MEWIKISEHLPDKYKEVIICSDEGRVKSAIHIEDGKFNTFLNVVAWTHFPEPPNWIECTESVEQTKKKRGRPKKQ